MSTWTLPHRHDRLARATQSGVDVVIIGGGITGAGIALDLAARGLRPLLVERDDWAQQTSSASSRLIHGGLRYLEHFDFGLVRESCLERGWLLDHAAGFVWPERFLFPIRRGDRVGRLKLLAGLKLYGALSWPRGLGSPGLIERARILSAVPGMAADRLVGGGTYLDAATHDARLTLAVMKSAVHAGAIAVSRVEARHISIGRQGVEVDLFDRLGGQALQVRAPLAVLAGGPSTDALRARAGLDARPWIAATRGSHIVLPRARLPIDGAVIFPGVDGRILFLIPWPRYTIVGTTDVDATPDAPIRASRAEIDYLIACANQLVPGAGIEPADVISCWAGLRPLLASDGSPSARSREERIAQEGPVFTIAGGKLTGFRAMAETLGARVVAALGRGRGGRRSPTREVRLVGALTGRRQLPTWPQAIDADDLLLRAHEHRYAAEASAVRAFCASSGDGDQRLDPETLLGEIDWACQHDDALSPADFLLRRSDLGYAGRAELERTLPIILTRMGALLRWSDAQRQQAEQETRAQLAPRHPELALASAPTTGSASAS